MLHRTPLTGLRLCSDVGAVEGGNPCEGGTSVKPTLSNPAWSKACNRWDVFNSMTLDRAGRCGNRSRS